MSETRTEEEIRNFVRDRYGEVAERGDIAKGAEAPESGNACGCGPDSAAKSEKRGKISRSLGYSEGELAGLPEGADMGLSCGNPVALALVSEGETLLDLGSGGGFDCFVAGSKVGAIGRVIGVDMTPAMITKARSGIEKYRERTGLDNVEFRLGEIEHLPVADASVDAVISNCVLN
ncbi:MAG: methyltransferase domain-containing protein, partial [Planctomycetes bacterium]|nr:methyltransferase domain-containing protein [Planctomycetota bacterium]